MKTKPEKNAIANSFNGIFLNTVIFLLAGLIIYMSYSLFVKLTFGEKMQTLPDKDGVPSEIIQAEVLNGCGISGIADRFTDYLRDKNIDIVNTGNYVSFDIEHSMVIDRIGNMANAKRIAKLLGIKEEHVFPQLNKDYFLDVTVVIGRDYHKLEPLN